MSVSTAVLPIARGTTYFDGGTTDSTSAEKLLGTTRTVNDTVGETGNEVTLKLVRNESGSTLAAGRPVVYKTGERGVSVSGYGSPYSARFAGYVDDAYASTIADNDIFWIVVDGPCEINGNTVTTSRSVHDLARGKFDVFEVSDDFTEYVTADTWTTVSDAGGSVALQDEDGGVIKLLTAATDNDGEYIHGTKKMFTFGAGAHIVAYARLKLTEANTDDANIVFGLVSNTATTSLSADGAGPSSNYSGVCFFKVDGGTVWQAEASVSTTQTTDTSAGTFTSAAYTELLIDCYTTSATSATAKFYVDGTEGASITFTYTSGAIMHPVVGVKAGAGNAESLFVDRVYVAQLRT